MKLSQNVRQVIFLFDIRLQNATSFGAWAGTHNAFKHSIFASGEIFAKALRRVPASTDIYAALLLFDSQIFMSSFSVH